MLRIVRFRRFRTIFVKFFKTFQYDTKWRRKHGNEWPAAKKGGKNTVEIQLVQSKLCNVNIPSTGYVLVTFCKVLFSNLQVLFYEHLVIHSDLNQTKRLSFTPRSCINEYDCSWLSFNQISLQNLIIVWSIF